MVGSPPFTDLVEDAADRTECANAKVRGSFRGSRTRKKIYCLDSQGERKVKGRGKMRCMLSC